MSQDFEIFSGRAQVTLSPEEARLLQLLHALEGKGLLMGEDDLQSYGGAETRFPGTLTAKGRAAAKASLYAQAATADKSEIKPEDATGAPRNLEEENALLRKALEPFASLASSL
ncbi:MAG: hypothetical protein IE938_21175, partial [Pseudomonas balearica]|nr:hypothetical protein [Stutzerimonas balearica]